jgi:hypothetical protein
MNLPTILHIQGEPCYPLKFWLFDKFSFMHKKKALMIDRGWYKTLSRDWSNNHLKFLSNEDFKKMTFDELKKFIS